jgi:serine/threonine-protein kinase HipA
MSSFADRRLAVILDVTPVGTLVQNSAGRLGFTYHRDYVAPTAIPLSMSMPPGRSSHPPKAVGAFLAGPLPDSEPTLERWGRLFGVSPRNPFALLAHVGMDAAGAVQILPEGTSPGDAATRQWDIRRLTDDDVRAMAQDLAVHAADWDAGLRPCVRPFPTHSTAPPVSRPCQSSSEFRPGG